ncbi:MAG: thiamine pyrophosphate-dependent enzyme [Bacteroidota bacterium]
MGTLNSGISTRISKEQRADQLDVWQTSLSNPNFAQFASSCGAHGIRVEDKRELEGAMQKLFDHDGPATLEIIADVDLI